MEVIGRIAMLAVCAAGLMSQAAPPPAGGTAEKGRPPTVLFLCPHGAAKSVLASAYFAKLAKERGLNVRVESAGTDPDPTVAPAIAVHLKANGYDVPNAAPRRVTAADMSAADVVISLGCDMKALPPGKAPVRRWDDVPPPSEDLDRAAQLIRERVMELVDELMRKQGR